MNYSEIEQKYNEIRQEYLENKEKFERDYFSLWPLNTKKIIYKCLKLKSKYQNLVVETLVYKKENENNIPLDHFEIENLDILIENCNNGINSLNHYLSLLSFYSSFNNSLFALVVALISLIIAVFALITSNHSDIKSDSITPDSQKTSIPFNLDSLQ